MLQGEIFLGCLRIGRSPAVPATLCIADYFFIWNIILIYWEGQKGMSISMLMYISSLTTLHHCSVINSLQLKKCVPKDCNSLEIGQMPFYQTNWKLIISFACKWDAWDWPIVFPFWQFGNGRPLIYTRVLSTINWLKRALKGFDHLLQQQSNFNFSMLW